MDADDDRPRQRASEVLAQLSREDLDPLSIAELDARVATLEAEIARTKAKRASAVNHKASAEALFRK